MAKIVKSGKCITCPYFSTKCVEINNSHNSGNGNPHQPGESLCWCCKHSIPSTKVANKGCEWSMYRQKVPGWTAEKVKLSDQAGYKTISYVVKRCPKFERG